MNQNLPLLLVACSLCVLLCFGAGCSGDTEGVTFYTEQYPPWNYEEDGQMKGIAVDLLNAAIKEAGAPLEGSTIKFDVWSRGYDKVLKTPNTAIFATFRLAEREDDFAWAGPIITSRQALFAPKDSGITISSADDLKDYTIGVVAGDAAREELIEAGVPAENIDEGSTPVDMLTRNMLEATDLFCYGEDAGRYYVVQTTGQDDTFDVVYTLGESDLYYAFNKETPEATVSAFQDALTAIKTDRATTGYSPYDEIVYHSLGPEHSSSSFSEDDVKARVNLTATAIESDAPGTIALINAGAAPYKNPDDSSEYVFVFSPDVTVLANAGNPHLVGISMKGKTDVAGTAFRDEFANVATTNGSGWVDYLYIKPDQGGLFYKSAWVTSVTGSDGETYIIGAGIYQ